MLGFVWHIQYTLPGASKGTPGDAKCVTEILGGAKIRKLGGTKFKIIVASRCHILRLKYTKFDFGWGCASDPTGGSHSAPPDSLAGFKGSYF